MHTIRILITLFMAAILVHCTNKEAKPVESYQEEPTLMAADPMLQLLTPEQSGIDFQNRIIETYDNNITTNINIYNGGGVAVLDINNDNLPDLYFIGANGPNGLFLNEGNMRFRNITESAGVASTEGFETAAVALDINSDGLLDLYVCRAGPLIDDDRRNRLYVNNGNLTFTEKGAEYGLNDISASSGANFFDYDNDGDLDCYLVNYPTQGVYTNSVEAKLGADDKYHPLLDPHNEFDTDRFYRNDNGRFTDVSKQAGIWNLGYGLSTSVNDFNRDGWLDVYVANDFVQPDRLYINNQNGTFTDRLDQFFRHISQHTMGTDIADFDNDGLVDLFGMDMIGEKNLRQKLFQSTNSQSSYTALTENGYMEPVVRNVLQRNNGNGTFSDVGCIAGVFKTDWSWSGLLFDMDNDGLRDLHVTNGYRRDVTNRDFIDFVIPEIHKVGSGRKLRDIYPDVSQFLNQIPSYKVRNYGFRNNGNWTFDNVSGKWMTMPASWSCGAAWADLDADGDLDLVVNNLEQPAFVYQNLSRQKNTHHYLQVKLQGNVPNTFAVGASIRIEYNNGQVQYFENFPTRGIFSSVEHLAHFGLGNVNVVDRLLVRWPDGKTQELRSVPADQRLVLKQSDAGGYTRSILPETASSDFIFKDVSKQSGVGYQHLENEYNDFEAFPLLPWSHADLGPLMAIGDVNGDGLDDLFVGNSFDQPAGLFAQQPNGSFKAVGADFWQKEKAFEDHGATFFDADADGDMDLFVLSGGAEAKPDVSQLAWENRLYINTDGKGAFARVPPGIIPDFGGNLALRCIPIDYDRDGDNDLICGGRILAGRWPLCPRTIVLRNDRNRFTDATAEVAPDLERFGMVTDLAVANLDNDPDPELVVVGEWTPVGIFDWQNGRFVNKTTQFGLEKTNGLWYRLTLADLDADGDLDLVTGNLGRNTRLTASADGPLKCYAKDFDNNGALDPIMAYFEDGKEYPLYQKEVLNKQMPILKKRLLYAREYSLATIDKVWPRKDLESAYITSAYTLETCWWENQNGRFVRRELPVQAQIAPVQGITALDVNADGALDLVLVGNKYGFEVETNRCDSGNGCVLLGDGKGNYRWLDNNRHGLWAMGEARDLAVLYNPAGRPILVVSNNNGPLQFFQFNQTGQPKRPF
ncbi:MAG: VCBS repeat-containing protein [Saprospiraceae bacterium]|nr:VCBS repeat-containing protein [Saprospiraceae bacterium]